MKQGAFILCLFSPWCSASTTDWRITPYGYGPVKTGMTVKQAEIALGTKLVPGSEGINAECYHVYPQAMHEHRSQESQSYRINEGLVFMVQNHRISRVSLYGGSTSVKTDKNIGIGDSERKVKKAYAGQLEITPHQYGEKEEKYLTYWNKKKSHGVRYETSNGSVDTIHGGASAIRYVEGCS